jgi:hypothetical protein
MGQGDSVKCSQEAKLTSCAFLVPGVPQGLNPPEKLGKFRQIIDRILKKERMIVD